jgi:TetR/AcrR family transcriptional repressor of nem operon
MTVTDSRNVKQHILDVARLLVSKKGFSAVGLNEVLQAAQVPKGSFYHYFGSKDAFGVALLEGYFDSYLEGMREIFQDDALPPYQQFGLYWKQWIDNQTCETDSGKCLAVKLGAEVADLSEPMRLALHRGTSMIIERLDAALSRGVENRNLMLKEDPARTALQLYSLWLGASVMAKITQTQTPFDDALSVTRQIVQFTDSAMF